MDCSYNPQSTGVRINEFNESKVQATMTDIDLQMRLVGQARQAHGAWFDCLLELAYANGYPRFNCPTSPLFKS
jgi:hypothetical protein